MGQTNELYRWQINCCTAGMKFILLFIVVMSGCSDGSEVVQQSLSTVDSNVVSIGDSTPAILHIDTTAGSDTAFDVAMDSAGPTITANDTLKK